MVWNYVFFIFLQLEWFQAIFLPFSSPLITEPLDARGASSSKFYNDCQATSSIFKRILNMLLFPIQQDKFLNPEWKRKKLISHIIIFYIRRVLEYFFQRVTAENKDMVPDIKMLNCFTAIDLGNRLLSSAKRKYFIFS